MAKINPLTEAEKCRKIKSILESFSRIPDIGIRTRRRKFAEMKKIYYCLCNELTTASLSTISFELGRYTHSTALKAIKDFYFQLDHKQISISDYYYQFLEQYDKNLNLRSKAMTPEETAEHWKVKFFKMVSIRKKLTDKLYNKINELETRLGLNSI